MRVLITGVTGQDGSYLAQQLAEAGHEVYGMLRGQYHPKRQWLENLIPGIQFVNGDLLDQYSLNAAIANADPEVIYNLGALTFVGMSWEQPAIMTEVTGIGVLRLLESVRQVNRDIRVVHASSSEQFGSSPAPQSELTPFRPKSPYGVAKVMAHNTVVNYRESYGMHASTAIMFNHTSPRRGLQFVERKVTYECAMIKAGLMSTLSLGYLQSSRDWGWAPDYMRALPLIAAQKNPDDYVLATGVTRTVREMVEYVFKAMGLDFYRYWRHEPSLMRPVEVEKLCGDAAKAQRVLGWTHNYSFETIMDQLIKHDLKMVKV